MPEKRTRRVLIPEKKKEIVEFKEKNPTFGQQKIADHFTQVWGYPVARRTRRNGKLLTSLQTR